jgi:hypothetical protein
VPSFARSTGEPDVKNKSEDLRNHLFATLEALQDKDNPMDIDRAKAVVDVAKEVINLARVEVDFMRVSGELIDSNFIKPQPRALPEPGAPRARLVGRG